MAPASHLKATSSTTGSVAEAAVSLKEEKYADIQFEFNFPLAFETLGPVNREVCGVLLSP